MKQEDSTTGKDLTIAKTQEIMLRNEMSVMDLAKEMKIPTPLLIFLLSKIGAVVGFSKSLASQDEIEAIKKAIPKIPFRSFGIISSVTTAFQLLLTSRINTLKKADTKIDKSDEISKQSLLMLLSSSALSQIKQQLFKNKKPVEINRLSKRLKIKREILEKLIEDSDMEIDNESGCLNADDAQELSELCMSFKKVYLFHKKRLHNQDICITFEEYLEEQLLHEELFLEGIVYDQNNYYPYQFKKSGEFWIVRFEGKIKCINDRTGMRYIAEALRNKGRPVEYDSLKVRPKEAKTDQVLQDDIGYKERVQYMDRLRREIEALKARNRTPEEENDFKWLQKEFEEQENQFKSLYTYGGGYELQKQEKRFRDAFRKNYRDALNKIKDIHNKLYQHICYNIRNEANTITYHGDYVWEVEI